MVVCDAQGGFGNKDVDGGVVNWKLLPAGIGHHCVGFAARRAVRISGAPSLSGEKYCIRARSRGSPHLDTHDPGGLGIVSPNYFNLEPFMAEGVHLCVHMLEVLCPPSKSGCESSANKSRVS
jgi:hypothetical protein